MANNNECPTNMDKEKKENMEKRRRQLQITIEKQDDRVNQLQTSAFQLANYYFVFQGFILGPIVTATSLLRCSDRWFLFSLSLIAAILNLVALIVIGGNYKKNVQHRSRTKSEYDQLESDLSKMDTSPSDKNQTSTILSYWIQASELELPTITSSPNQHQHEPKRRHSTRVLSRHGSVDYFKKRVNDFYFILCMGLFVSFAVIVVVGCWTIPCNKTLQCVPAPISNTSHGHKCVRLCQASRCISICTEY